MPTPQEEFTLCGTGILPVQRERCNVSAKKYFKKGLTNLGEFGNVINVEQKRYSASSLTQTQDSKFSKLSWCL